MSHNNKLYLGAMARSKMKELQGTDVPLFLNSSHAEEVENSPEAWPFHIKQSGLSATRAGILSDQELKVSRKFEFCQTEDIKS